MNWWKNIIAGAPIELQHRACTFTKLTWNQSINSQNDYFSKAKRWQQPRPCDNFATESKIDFIHGEKSLRKLSDGRDKLGFLLSAMKKSDLFKTVSLDGALPRKTFSMGEAEEKRYYFEARKIRW